MGSGKWEVGIGKWELGIGGLFFGINFPGGAVDY
jgi:hypothetical protein